MTRETIDFSRGPCHLPKAAPLVGAAAAGVVVADCFPEWRAAAWCLALAAAVAWFARFDCRPALLVAVAAAFGLSHALDRAARARFPLAEPLRDEGRIEVVAVGVVADAPVAGARGLRFPLRIESVSGRDGAWRARATVLAWWRAPDTREAVLPTCGDRLEVRGWLEEARRARNPGQFDTGAWFERKRFVAALEATRLRVTEPAAALPMKRLALRVRGWLESAITHDLDGLPTEAAVVKAMVLGTRDDMAGDVDRAFLLSGTLHIFSVSGLHVGFVAMILWRLLNLLRLRRRQAAWASIPLVMFYALVTGWEPAAARSAVMASVVLLGIGLDRPPAFFNSLCLAALWLLAADTHQLFMPGAQLSFVVIGAIGAASHPVAGRFRRILEPDPFLPRLLWGRCRRWGWAMWSWIANMLAVSTVAGAGSTPLTLWHFQLATPISLAANMLHVPLAGFILATAGLSAATHSWWPAAASVFAHANAALARVCLVTAGWFAEVPGGAVQWNPRLFAEPAASCRITVFDVGDGGAVLVRTPSGKAWLIDTGRPSAFRGIVAPGLSWHAVGRLDGLVLSHGDHDHVGAALEALDQWQPPVLGHSPHPSRSPALRAALAHGASIARPLAAGDSLALDDAVTLTVLWPPSSANAPLADDACLVLRLDFAGRTVILSNDAGFLAERAILKAHPDLRADIWIRGHHASDLSGLPDFVARLKPALVVSAGAAARAAPRLPAERRTRLEAAGARVVDQSAAGAVEIVIRPDGAWSHREFIARSDPP